MQSGEEQLSLGKFQFYGRMQGYSLEAFRKDIIAGIIVGVVAIPLALAFAIASGVRPEYGIYTSIIAGALVGIFGGSRVQIAGPTGAFVPVLLSIVMLYGFNNLLLASLLSGFMLILMGVTHMGTLIKFIPRPVTVGFTAGIAVIIFTGQVDTFLGLQGVAKHEYFIQNVLELTKHLHTVQVSSIIVALVCLFFLIFTDRYIPGVPGPLAGILVSTLVATFFFGGAIETIGSKFGSIPAGLPEFRIPKMSLNEVYKMIGPAFTIAMLGSIESLLSCMVADEMIGNKHNSNKELIGQGIANVIAPLFGGIAATGAIARTATNIRSGGTSPVSAVVHSLTVLILIITLAPMVSQIPLASMAPILMIVAWNMSSKNEIKHILRTTRSDSTVLITTFLLTVFVNLTVAVGFGLLLAVALFINRMSDTMSVQKVLPDHNGREKVTSNVVSPIHDCPQVAIFTINGALFFGAVETFEQTLTNCLAARPKVLILRMGNVFVMDATAEVVLEHIVDHFQRQKGTILISGLKTQPKKVLKNSGLYDKIGKEHFFGGTGLAISYALTKISAEKCRGCSHNAFYECSKLSIRDVG
ncbi:sulphate transporter [Desulforamulus reducens MI-1]|uniref:Sulphate transporter n=1 Tax=Desulforamulus reducens (strain ATCC BAA-1160 / DSM 100696 / MI-1) TaxID=349161 RepID=A4J518_DESRM|nr:SulP family inorganic anion transporter [Desulforamulus reducens]ABO50171.1 sulphate transporter [Desulforamulus reducens MI-1]